MANNLNYWKREYVNLKEKIKIFKNIKKEDKIGKDKDKYYIDKLCIRSKLSRTFWTKESRIKTSLYLKEDFNLLINLIEKIISLTNNRKNLYFLDSIKDFTEEIIIGLENLRVTYNNDKGNWVWKKNTEIIKDIDNIILNLKDVNNRIYILKKDKEFNIQKINTLKYNYIMETISI
jgi:hypothetical protein